MTENPDACPELENINVTSGLHYVRSDSEDMVANIYFSQDTKFSPLVLYFNSASLVKSARRDASLLCRSIAKKGFVCVEVRIRPLQRHDSVEDRFLDIEALVKWISTYDSVYNIDLNRVYCIGTGMGAVAATWAAMLCNSERFSYFRKDMPFTVKALGIFNGYISVRLRDGDCRTLSDFMAYLMKNDRHMYNWLDPWFTKAEGLPPTFITTSDNDPAKYDCLRFKELLDQEGIPNRCMMFTRAGLKDCFMEKDPLTAEAIRVLSAMQKFFSAGISDL